MKWWLIIACIVVSASALFNAELELVFPPVSWGVLSLCLWTFYVACRGWDTFGTLDKYQFFWGIFSALCFLNFLQYDQEFQGWADVYFFCGSNLQYCTCNFRWNVLGWLKATVIWNFVLASALGCQSLVFQLGLQGLLPGEEVVTRESFISICWRLIPYWLNNWEQRWGAECSSMMFELPHFVVELLIVLPCVQILCARMKILVLPPANVIPPPAEEVRRRPVSKQDFAPNILAGYWEWSPEQRSFFKRIRKNMRLMMVTTGIITLAAVNSLLVPLYLERQIALHPFFQSLRMAGKQGENLNVYLYGTNATTGEGAQLLNASDIPVMAHGSTLPSDYGFTPFDFSSKGVFSNRSLKATPSVHDLRSDLGSPAGGKKLPFTADVDLGAIEHRVTVYSSQAKGCQDVKRLGANLAKHATDLARMSDPEHATVIPLVESALAVMRLSCEKFFVLLSIFVSFLLFRDPPYAARLVIRLNNDMSTFFQRVILFAFPAVCWIYGAGIIFSTFVSIVFWTGPIKYIISAFSYTTSDVRIRNLKPATARDIDRMGPNCPICWEDMTPAVADRGTNTQEPGATPAAPAPGPSAAPAGARGATAAAGGVAPNQGASSESRRPAAEASQRMSRESSVGSPMVADSGIADGEIAVPKIPASSGIGRWRSAGTSAVVGGAVEDNESLRIRHKTYLDAVSSGIPGAEQRLSHGGAEESSAQSSAIAEDSSVQEQQYRRQHDSVCVTGSVASHRVSVEQPQSAGTAGSSAITSGTAIRRAEQQSITTADAFGTPSGTVAIGAGAEQQYSVAASGSSVTSSGTAASRRASAEQQRQVMAAGGSGTTSGTGTRRSSTEQQQHSATAVGGSSINESTRTSRSSAEQQREVHTAGGTGVDGAAAAAPPIPPQAVPEPQARVEETDGANTASANDDPSGVSLPCNHAFHHRCLHAWLAQCHAGGITPTCPMCTAKIELEVKWQRPTFRRQNRGRQARINRNQQAQRLRRAGGAAGPDDLANVLVGPFLEHADELAELLTDMPQIVLGDHVVAPVAPAPVPAPVPVPALNAAAQRHAAPALRPLPMPAPQPPPPPRAVWQPPPVPVERPAAVANGSGIGGSSSRNQTSTSNASSSGQAKSATSQKPNGEASSRLESLGTSTGSAQGSGSTSAPSGHVDLEFAFLERAAELHKQVEAISVLYHDLRDRGLVKGAPLMILADTLRMTAEIAEEARTALRNAPASGTATNSAPTSTQSREDSMNASGATPTAAQTQAKGRTLQRLPSADQSLQPSAPKNQPLRHIPNFMKPLRDRSDGGSTSSENKAAVRSKAPPPPPPLKNSGSQRLPSRTAAPLENAAATSSSLHTTSNSSGASLVSGGSALTAVQTSGRSGRRLSVVTSMNGDVGVDSGAVSALTSPVLQVGTKSPDQNTTAPGDLTTNSGGSSPSYHVRNASAPEVSGKGAVSGSFTTASAQSSRQVGRVGSVDSAADGGLYTDAVEPSQRSEEDSGSAGPSAPNVRPPQKQRRLLLPFLRRRPPA